jgi:hypothetical protein
MIDGKNVKITIFGDVPVYFRAVRIRAQMFDVLDEGHWEPFDPAQALWLKTRPGQPSPQETIRLEAMDWSFQIGQGPLVPLTDWAADLKLSYTEPSAPGAPSYPVATLQVLNSTYAVNNGMEWLYAAHLGFDPAAEPALDLTVAHDYWFREGGFWLPAEDLRPGPRQRLSPLADPSLERLTRARF